MSSISTFKRTLATLERRPKFQFIMNFYQKCRQFHIHFIDGEYCLTLSFYMRGSSVYFGIYKAGPGWLWSTSDPGNVWQSLTMTFNCESSSYMVSTLKIVFLCKNRRSIKVYSNLKKTTIA